MATTKTHHKDSWDTIHKNGPFPLKIIQITNLAGETKFPNKLDRYNDATSEIQKLIREAKTNGDGFRAYGSRWSLSDIAHQKDRMHYNGYMNLHIPVNAEDQHSQSPYDIENLFYFQCGNTIKEISHQLEEHGKSIMTSGASNGQTIAGCISTGVHGSAIDVGSIQDFVRGIHIITGPNPEDSIYIERNTKPALNDAFAQKINARIIRNDELFKAALVSLGSFGFIHGVLIEGEDLFLLKRYVRKIDKQTALQLATTMDFANSDFTIPEEVDQNGKGLRPFHYKVFINQYSDENEYVVEFMYKKNYETPYPDPFPIIKQSLYKDLIYLFIKIAEKFPKKIPKLVKALRKTILPAVNEVTTGTLAETFWDAGYQGPAFACSFGVAHEDSERTLEVLAKLTNDEGPFPGIFAMRFIKKSEATLAFSKFPITCMIEIDGVLWKESRKLMSLEKYGRRMIEVLKENNIPFTIHWGKNADWAFPGLVDHMFGAEATKWMKIRSTLLSEDMHTLFSNDFLDRTGLSKREATDDTLIANLPIT